MPITYHVIQRGEPGVVGGGTQQYYAAAVSQGEATIDDLTHSIEKRTTMSGADIRGVLYALTEVIPEELADGNIVRLGDLGNFRVSISSEGHQLEEDVTPESITDARILFDPDEKFEVMLRNLEYVEGT